MKFDHTTIAHLSGVLRRTDDESIAERAVRRGWLSREDLSKTAAALAPGRSLRDALSEGSLLSPAQWEELTREIPRAESRRETPAEVREAEADPQNNFGAFVLVSRVERGGMAELWKAWDRELDRFVALKILRHGSAELRRRFANESLRLARLSHPNIVPVYRASEVAGAPFIAMAWIEGRTLDQETLTVREGLEAIEISARAVHDAHLQGMVHRDLKPQNIMRDARGHLYLVDFGLAKEAQAEDAAGTQTGAVLGTPAYMAPEQARGETREIGPRTDVYALGATLYELCAGRPPFDAANLAEYTVKIAHEEPAPPRQVNRQLHPDIETIILKALEKAPDHRYADAKALADDVRRYLEGEPILARPAPLGRRMLRQVKRYPAIAAALLTTAIFVVVLVGSWIYIADQINAEWRSQEAGRQMRLERIAQKLGEAQAEILAHVEYERALKFIVQGEYPRALFHLDSAIGYFADFEDAYRDRAEVHRRLGHEADAERDLKAIEAIRRRLSDKP